MHAYERTVGQLVCDTFTLPGMTMTRPCFPVFVCVHIPDDVVEQLLRNVGSGRSWVTSGEHGGGGWMIRRPAVREGGCDGPARVPQPPVLLLYNFVDRMDCCTTPGPQRRRTPLFLWRDFSKA